MDALIMSFATDTNGQNARFGKAAERWGNDPDVMKALALGNQDPAGVVARFQLAAASTDSLRIRSVHRVETYMQFPGDIAWSRENEPLIRQLVDEADVIHLNNSYRPIQRYRVRKPMLLHHHGSLFRNNPAHMLQVAKGYRMTQAVSTLDLTRFAPDVLNWLPTAYDIDWLQDFAAQRRKGARRDPNRVRIVHCPTNREFKATQTLIAAVEEVRQGGTPIDLIIVEGKPWMESLVMKASADIVFDQLAWGYGCNGVEAMGMGVPLVSGADEWTLARMRKEWRTLPFLTATESTLASVLRSLVASPAKREEWGQRGLRHVRKYHDEKPALARLAELYSQTIVNYSSWPDRLGRAPKPVRFYSQAGRSISLDGQPVTFEDGVVVTDDPVVISRLRYFAKERPAWGITEDVA